MVQAEIDQGQRAGLSREESAEIRRLRKENAELKHTNEILKLASAFFAKELDHPAIALLRLSISIVIVSYSSSFAGL